MSRVATCFGGPRHGQTLAFTGNYVTVALVDRNMLRFDQSELDPIAPVTWRKHNYIAREFAFYPKGLARSYRPMTWWALCWENGWIEDETVERHIELGMQLMYELARAWNGVS